jgi:hypothetical protein
MANHPGRLFLCLCAIVCSTRPGVAKEKLTFTPKESGPYQAKPASCEIQVFQEESKPDGAYVDVGVINFHDERHRAKDGALKLEVVLPKLKAKACSVGGDALVAVRVTEVRRLEFVMFNVRATVARFTKSP